MWNTSGLMSAPNQIWAFDNYGGTGNLPIPDRDLEEMMNLEIHLSSLNFFNLLLLQNQQYLRQHGNSNEGH